MPKSGLLVVEDTTSLADSLARGFAEAGFDVRVARSGQEADRELEQGRSDLVVLDLGLPDIDGTELLVRERARGSFVPILVLTARDAIASRVQALEAGADDYLIKPFAFVELLARVRSLLRRANPPQRGAMTFARMELSPNDPTLIVAGERRRLSPREHALLAVLLRRCGEIVPRRDLLSEVFGYRFDPGTNVVDVHVSNLRKKLAGAGVVVEAVRGFGYRLRASDG